MKKISDFKLGGVVPIDRHKQSVGVVSSEAALIVNKLFSELKVLFPAWKQAFPGQDDLDYARMAWSKGFVENGIVTMEQVRLGLRVARKGESPFFPALGQFISWCKPDLADFGLPDVEAAYREACCSAADHAWSHPAVLVAAREAGQFELRSRPRRESFPIFARNYEVVCRRVLAGEKLDAVIPKALPAEVSITASDKTVKRCFGEINSILGR